MSVRIIGSKTRGEMEREWSELLGSALTKRGKLPPGDGWLTFDQLVEAHKIAPGTLRKAIRELRAQKKIEVFDGADVVNGSVSRKVWYRKIGGAA